MVVPPRSTWRGNYIAKADARTPEEYDEYIKVMYPAWRRLTGRRAVFAINPKWVDKIPDEVKAFAKSNENFPNWEYARPDRVELLNKMGALPVAQEYDVDLDYIGILSGNVNPVPMLGPREVSFLGKFDKGLQAMRIGRSATSPMATVIKSIENLGVSDSKLHALESSGLLKYLGYARTGERVKFKTSSREVLRRVK